MGLKFYFNFYLEQTFLPSWIKNRKGRDIYEREVRKTDIHPLSVMTVPEWKWKRVMQLPKWLLSCFSLEKKGHLGMWVIQWYQLLGSWFLQDCPGYCPRIWKPGRKSTTVLWRNQMCRGIVVNLQDEGQKTREGRQDRACKLGERKI